MLIQNDGVKQSIGKSSPATKMFACISVLSCVLSKSLALFLNCQHSEVCKFK